MASVVKDVEVDMAKFRLPDFTSGTFNSRNVRVAGVPNFVDGQIVSKTRMLIVALDYNNDTATASPIAEKGPLTCTTDAKNVEDLANKCGCDVTSLYNEQCTKENVLAAITKVGQSCKRDDFFVFYFAGHGTQIKDINGDEEDGLDEAFVLVNKSGQVTSDTLLIDDDFSEAMYQSCQDPRTRVLILMDCGLDVADLSGRKWSGRRAIAISGFVDNQKEGHKHNTNGLFTNAMLLGVDKIGNLETRTKQPLYNADSMYSAGMLYNAALLECAAVFGSKQDLTIQCTADAMADKMPWPLLPPAGYESPLRLQAMGNPSPVEKENVPEEKGGIQALIAGCGVGPCRGLPGMAMRGSAVSPVVLASANLKNVLPAVPANYVKMLQGTDFQLKAERSCHSDKCVVS